MSEGDLLMITADHGCDPATESTDHSREYVPLIIYGESISPKSLGTLCGFSHIAATVCAAYQFCSDYALFCLLYCICIEFRYFNDITFILCTNFPVFAHDF